MKETDKIDLTEKGKMLKTLLTNKKMKIGEMRSLRLPVNLNELANKFEGSQLYITVRDIMTYKESVNDIPMDTGTVQRL